MTITHAELRSGQPIWLTPRAAGQAAFPALRGHHDADAVIIGGGITGALIAYAFASAGVRVVLLEAQRVSRGSTAASSALLLQEPDAGLRKLTERYGTTRARRIWALCRDAVRDLTRTLQTLQVDCALRPSDSILYTTREPGAVDLRREFEMRQAAGFGSAWLSSAALREHTGIAGYGAIRTSQNGHFDPHRACLGILAGAQAQSAALFEQSPVRRIDGRGDRVRVHTSRGSVDASRVIVATGYATSQFRPLAGRFAMYRTYVLGTRSVTGAERRAIGMGDVMLWDDERPYHYARWTADRRLLLGGADRVVRRGARRDLQFKAATRELRQHFAGLLPALTTIDIEHAWEGLFALTPDSLPYIGPHRRYPRHLFALGYGGNGMTFGALSARMLLEMWQGVRSADHRLFAFNRLRP